MKKIYHLATCSTCQRIISEVGISAMDDIEMQDIKTVEISPAQLDAMRDLAGSYEALFSRRAMKFRSMGLADRVLSENDYRALILEEYTFLKRPVIVVNKQIFIGSSKKTVEAAAKALR